MFTVKATYRDETRKFSFPEPAVFPTYEQLYHQLYRVFPISHSYYLSKLLFSPNSNHQRVLLGKEAHTADEYNAHIASYRGREWPGALLKFHVFDETVHKNVNDGTSSARDSFVSTGSQSSATFVETLDKMVNLRKNRDRERDELRVLLQRLRERTGRDASSLAQSTSSEVPPSDSESTLSLAASVTTDSTATCRPLPPIPAPGSGPSNAARYLPSLDDLLSGESTRHANARATAQEHVFFDPQSAQSRLARLRERRSAARVTPSDPESDSSPRTALLTRRPSMQPQPPPLVIPPPPILYPTFSAATSTQQPRITPVMPLTPQQECNATAPQPPQGTSDQDKSKQPAPQHCCSIAEGKTEIRALLKKFTSDFERTMEKTFGPDWRTSAPASPAADVTTVGSLPADKDAIESRRVYRSLFDNVWSATETHDNGMSALQDALHAPFDPSNLFKSESGVLHARQDNEPSAPIADEIARSRKQFRSIIELGPPATPVHTSLFAPQSPAAANPSTSQTDTAALNDESAMPGSFAPPVDKPAPESLVLPLFVERMQPPAEEGPKHTGTRCDVCNKRGFTGARFKCLDCADYDLCSTCMLSPEARALHSMDHSFWPIDQPHDYESFNAAWAKRHGLVTHTGVFCGGCDEIVKGVRHKCLDCESYDFCTSCITTRNHRQKHPLDHAFFPIIAAGDKTDYDRARDMRRAETAPPVEPATTSVPVAAPRPAVHKNVFCDMCMCQVTGIRYKCLDCPDFDMCNECYANAAVRAQHSQNHVFFAIDRPEDNLVHIILDDYSEPQTQPTPAPPSPSIPEPAAPQSAESPAAPTEPVVHSAMCNLCDSRIRGERYKCVNCPDFDTCARCFSITEEQHPEHGFVKINTPAELMMRGALRRKVIHSAECDICHTRIVGTRYKCMHESCPDFDLCSSCEALPIPVHPIAHPLLKIKSADTVMPSTSRASVRPSSVSPRLTSPPTPQVAARHTEPLPLEPCSRYGAQAFNNFMTSLADDCPADVTLDVDEHLSATPVPEQQPLTFSQQLPEEQSEAERREDSVTEQVSDDQFLEMVQTVCERSRREFRALIDLESSAPLPSQPDVSTVLPPLIPTVPTSPISFAPCLPEILTPPAVNNDTRPTAALLTPPLVEKPLIQIFRESFAEQDSERNSQVGTDSSLGGMTTPPEVPDLTDASHNSIPHLGPVSNTEWRNLWPELTTIFNHLLQPGSPQRNATPLPADVSMPGAISFESAKVPAEAPEPTSAVEESPLVGEPLLCRPLPADPDAPRLTERRLDEFMIPVEPPTSTSISSPTVVAPAAPRGPLFASYLSDNNIPDGQVFPPGAEFVKSWRMFNDGVTEWPESTELVFVAGDRLASHANAPRKVKVGSVPAGAKVEIVAGEMKAPEVPGKYVSYWRLSDGENLFGHSIWVDIMVAEVYHAASEFSSAEESLAASSVIMPQAAPEPSANGEQGSAIVPTLSVTIPSSPRSETSISDSSISLVDAPSSSLSDDEDAVYEDSRSHAFVSSAVERPVVRETEYVMLYETSSSSEDD